MQQHFFHREVAGMLHLQPIRGKRFGFIVPAPGSKQTFLFGGIFLFKFCKHKLSSPLFGLKPTRWVHVTGRGNCPRSSAPGALPGAALKCP